MNTFYSNDLKKSVCERICINHCSTSLIAKELNIPIKTIEKWVTAFNKNPFCFDRPIVTISDIKLFHPDDPINLDDLSNDELKLQIMKKDIEIARLKKAYTVKEGGMGRKEFISFSKKNSK